MKAIDPAGFEAKFRLDRDPWNYTSSPFEARKRGALIRACGTRRRGNALELACANGITTLALAPICLRLLAVDSAPTAVAEAKRRTKDNARISVQQAVLPQDMPRRKFDLIVVSELLYYLPPNALRQLLGKIAAATLPGGRVVLLHHLKNFADAAQPPPHVHAEAKRRFRSKFTAPQQERRGAYEILIFDRRLK